MAQIIGTSQAWGQVSRILAKSGIKATSISDIHALLRSRRSECENVINETNKMIENRLQHLDKELHEEKENYPERVEDCRKQLSLEIELFRIAIQILKEERGIIRRTINYLKIRGLRSRLANLEYTHRKCPEILQQKIVEKEKTIRHIKSNRERLVKYKSQNLRREIHILQEILASPEYAGADAELELIEHLRRLPNDYIVVNDVKIISRQPIRFDGQWLRSAQIDHIVFSPAGVFVIEAKNWSKEFTKHGNYFDPYQQVKRSSHLCYKYLKHRLKRTIVRSIIAHRGNIPKKPVYSFSKPLHIRDVNNYILRFKDKLFSDREIKDLSRVFTRNKGRD